MVEPQHDEQTFRRGGAAAFIGFAAHLLLTVGVALMAVYAQATAVYDVTWFMLAGLPVWAVLWMLFKQHRLERLESLEAEQLAASDAQAAQIFDEAGEQLAVARRRLEGFYRWGLNAVAGVVGGYWLILGSVLAWLSYRTIANSEVLANLLAGRTFLEDALANGPQGSMWWLLVLQIGAAFVGFLVARYVAGMTRVPAWQVLRGAAGVTMGAAVALVVLALASLVTILGYPLGYEFASLIVSIFMALVGLEICINLVLDLYRPHKPGEHLRPAFDSRILGWLTSPESIGKIISDTLNYQFGFEMSRTWLYSALGRAVLPLCIFAIAVLLLLSSIVIVGPQQNAVITRFGAFVRIAEPGMSFKWPYPIGQAEKLDVNAIRSVTIGSHFGELTPDAALLWTNQHTNNKEEYLVTAPTIVAGSDTRDSQSLAAGLAGARMTVLYRISDPKAWILSASDPARLVEDVATARMNAYFVTHDIDSLLTTGRQSIEQQLSQSIQQSLNQIALGNGGTASNNTSGGATSGGGVEILLVSLSTIHPPQDGDVAAAFHENIDARQEMVTTIEKAKRDAVQTLATVAGSRDKALAIANAIRELEPLREQLQDLDRKAASGEQVDEAQHAALAKQVAQRNVAIGEMLKDAGGEAAKISREAEAYAIRVAISQQAAANRFNFQLKAYRAAPHYYRMRQYLETLADGLAERRKIVMAADGDVPPTIRVNLENMGGQMQLITPNE